SLGPTGGAAVFPLASGWLIESTTGAIGDVGGALVRPFPQDLDGGTAAFGGSLPFQFARAPRGGAWGVVGVHSDDPACHAGPFTDGLGLQRFASSGQPTGPVRGIGCADTTTGGNVAVAENVAGDVVAFSRGSAWHLAPDGTLTPIPAP